MVTVALALAVVLGAGLQATNSVGGSSPKRFSTPGQAAAPQGPASGSQPDHPARDTLPGPSRRLGDRTALTTLPGLGPKTLAKIPASSRQVLVALGKGKKSPNSTVTLYTRTMSGSWVAGSSWPAHNGLRGWSRRHVADDLRSPIGVFTLSDAGGLAADPGTALPYYRSSGFTIQGTGFRGEDLEGTFDHVVAIDYNRLPGRSPLDGEQPLGKKRGGGIWLHIDHGGPTHGCLTLAEKNLIRLMRTLDPKDSPVIVMGDHRSLAR